MKEKRDLYDKNDELTEVRWFNIETLRSMVETKELNEDQVAFFEKSMKYLSNN